MTGNYLLKWCRFQTGLLRRSKTGMIPYRQNKKHSRREQTKQENAVSSNQSLSQFFFFKDIQSIHILYQSENGSIAIPFN